MNSDLKKRLNDIFRYLPLPVLVIPECGSFLINEAFHKFSGYHEKELSLELLSSSVENYEEIFETPISNGANFLELIFKHKNGNIIKCITRFDRLILDDTSLYLMIADSSPKINSNHVYLRLNGRNSSVIYENEKLNILADSGVLIPENIQKYELADSDGAVILSAEILDAAALPSLFYKIAELSEKLNSKDKFLSIIAHDLKSPFAGFLGFSEYLAKYSAELSREEIEDFSSRMFKSAKLVFRLIENLLAWTRIQTGRIEFLPRDFNICEVVKRLQKLNLPAAENKLISLTAEMPKTLNVYADEDMVETILRNLISNAIKFTGIGGKVSIKIFSEGDKITAEVQDNGVGIKDENISKLFRIDSQVLTKGTNQEEGTGLGLILCREFAEMNGGSITVESSPGIGSKFTLTLPSGIIS